MNFPSPSLPLPTPPPPPPISPFFPAMSNSACSSCLVADDENYLERKSTTLTLTPHHASPPPPPLAFCGCVSPTFARSTHPHTHPTPPPHPRPTKGTSQCSFSSKLPKKNSKSTTSFMPKKIRQQQRTYEVALPHPLSLSLSLSLLPPSFSPLPSFSPRYAFTFLYCAFPPPLSPLSRDRSPLFRYPSISTILLPSPSLPFPPPPTHPPTHTHTRIFLHPRTHTCSY